MAKVRNRYNHTIDLKKITIKNTSRKEFAQSLIKLPYRGYEVEDLSDGRKRVLTKPGGKTSYGRLSKEDFLVFIYTPATNDLWQAESTAGSSTDKKTHRSFRTGIERNGS